MSGRCFGDTRDLFKFDLVRHIMKSIPELEGVTLVPMLTGTETAGPKRGTAKKNMDKAYRSGLAGSQNRGLLDHLEQLQEIDSDIEYFTGLATYFSKEMILISVPCSQNLSDTSRDAYFRAAFHKFPKNNLIVIDPDAGLTGEGTDCRYLLYPEIKKIFTRMDAGSILMLYQRLPRGKRADILRGTCERLEECTGIPPAIITDHESAFFILAKNQKRADRLRNSIGCYADTYPALECVA